MRLLALAILVPAVAAAQPARDMAKLCSGKPAGDDAVACGHHFLDAYNKAPGAAHADTHLYDAGPAARYYYARAMLLRSDADAESVPMPAAPRGANLAAWTREQVVARGKLHTRYESVFAAKDAATSIAAASRIGRLSDDLASAIVATATKPADCKALAETAAPFRENAIRAYAVCLAKASEVGFFEESARTCEAALARLAPDEFPPLREIVGPAPAAATVLAVSGP